MQLFIGDKKYINSYLEKKKIKFIKNEYGKPINPESKIFFNKSHCKEFSVLLLDNSKCGIDVEKIRKYNDVIARKMCSEEEYEYLNYSKNKDYDFTLLWVAKEAYLKCLGIGISISMKNISFALNKEIKIQKDGYDFKVKNLNEHIIVMCCER